MKTSILFLLFSTIISVAQAQSSQHPTQKAEDFELTGSVMQYSYTLINYETESASDTIVTVRKFNESQRLIEEHIFPSKWNPKEVSIYTVYDSQNLPKEIRRNDEITSFSFDADKLLLTGMVQGKRKVEYGFNAEGAVLYRKTYKKKVISLVENTYNESSQLVSSKSESKQWNTTTQYQYDETGLLVKDAMEMGDKGYQVRVYSYNDKGEVVKIEVESNLQTWELVYSYTYDEFGNWITRKARMAGELVVEEIRVIDYFE